MYYRLLGLILGLLLTAGCAQLPQVELDIVRAEVASAYAGGAKVLAPAEYEAASAALHDAEVQVARGRYAQARESLNMALLHATKSRAIAKDRAEAAEAQQRAEEIQAEREAAARKTREEAARKKKVLVKPRPKVRLSPPKPEPVLLEQVRVTDGDTLFSLAARKDVYADGLLWPLIYRANRDQIKNPVQIFAGQVFDVPRDKSDQEQAAARKEALDSGLFRSP